MAANKFKIVEELHCLQDDEEAVYRKELNLVEWFDRKAKYDIRGWNADHTKSTKGISLTDEEFKELILFGIGHLGLSLKEGIANVNV